MIGVVSGDQRSGCCMFLSVLSGLGLTLLSERLKSKPFRPGMKSPVVGYNPYPSGFYSFSRGSDLKSGSVGFVSCKELLCLPNVGVDYSVVYMTRHSEEIRLSSEKAGVEFSDRSFGYACKQRDLALGVLAARKDVRVTLVSYADFIDNPSGVMFRLFKNGWKLNPRDAERFVDKDLYRNRVSLSLSNDD